LFQFWWGNQVVHFILLTPICIHGHFAPCFFPCDTWWVFTKYLLNITRKKTSLTFKLCKAFEGGLYWIQIHVQFYFTRPLFPIKFAPSTWPYIWSSNQIFRVDFLIVLKGDVMCHLIGMVWFMREEVFWFTFHCWFVEELFPNIVGMLMSPIQDNMWFIFTICIKML
jgi:hypothetical protein